MLSDDTCGFVYDPTTGAQCGAATVATVAYTSPGLSPWRACHYHASRAENLRGTWCNGYHNVTRDNVTRADVPMMGA